MGFEGVAFGVGHRSTLEVQAVARRVRKVGEIFGVFPAEVALGRDVEADGLDDFGREPCGKMLGAEIFMGGVDAVIGNIFAEVVAKMTEIVDEAGSDHLRRLPGFASKSGALEGVLGFGDGFAVKAMTSLTIKLENLIDDLVGMVGVHGV